MDQGLNTKHNLLIVTSLWTGIKPFFYDAKVSSKGMPAFTNVFFELLNNPKVGKVYIFIVDDLNSKSFNIPPSYKDKIEIHCFNYDQSDKIFALIKFIKIIYLGIRLVKKQNISRILGFGSISGLSAIIGKFTGIPDFRRIYGSFLINEIKSPSLYLFIRHPLEYIAFCFNGKALIATNDGTKCDIVFNKIGNKKLPFHFLLNGVDENIFNNLKSPDFDLPSSYISYIARVTDWKRQHLLIEALGILKQQSFPLPKTLIIGSLADKNYVKYLSKLIEDLKLSNDVFLIDGIETSQVHYVLSKSILTFSLYHTSNLGNVFLEALKLGIPVLALNDTNSLSLINKSAYYELLSDDPRSIALATETLLSNDSLRKSISLEALKYANENLMTWKDRTKIEIDIILK